MLNLYKGCLSAVNWNKWRELYNLCYFEHILKRGNLLHLKNIFESVLSTTDIPVFVCVKSWGEVHIILDIIITFEGHII